ncbi:MAG: 4-hydroxythreonine-4-phosphate dehydrogenase PdxA [Prevotellaceae bacterium]|jgi:4-hydroxythreonine-4-phosphate dehydrogenase|nr:4-hydroxythreonine-4-phosphate dehydrogenase PdxA [Prevotellaceae bacterium]
MEKDRIKIGITQGDINGVSYEVIIKTLADLQLLEMFTPVIYGSPKVAAYYRKMLDIQGFNLNIINSVQEANSRKVNMIDCCDDLKVETGKASVEAGQAAMASLSRAVADLKEGLIDALVTTPVDRESISTAEQPFLGHAEYLEKQFNQKDGSFSLLLNDNFRVALLTRHIPLSNVSKTITKDLLINKLKQLNKILIQDFGVRRPRIAVLSLNPPAGEGEDVTFGSEEAEIFVPAIKQLNDSGMVCVGPLAADLFFGSGDFSKYDAVLAAYHDQGMAPFNAVSVDMGVNYTANLPVIRTAPLHGTEYDIAGKNIASEESFRNALYEAIDIYRNRKLYEKINANPLKKQEADRRGNSE